MPTPAHTEHVPNEAIWLDRVTLYDCPHCRRPVPSQYEGKDVPQIACLARHGGSGHILVWEAREDVDAPVIESLVPSTAVLGSPSFTLRVLGTGFTEQSSIVWNGSPEPTAYVSPTELTTGVNMATATAAVTLPVAVLDGEILSNELAFTFESPAAA